MPPSALDSVDEELLQGRLDEAQIADVETFGVNFLPSADDCVNKLLAIILVDYSDQLNLWNMEARAMSISLPWNP